MGHGVEYYIKVGIASLLWHSDLPRYPAGKTFLFQIKKYVKYDLWPIVRLGIRPQLLSMEFNRRRVTGLVKCCQQDATIGVCC